MSDDVETGGGRYIPISDLDFASMTTDPAWKDFSKDMEGYFHEKDVTDDKTGEVKKQKFVDVNAFVQILSYYTRDLRLGNLSMWNGEYDYCRTRLDIASDILRFKPLMNAGRLTAFFTALTRVISVTELSQSKGGFFRRRPNTITSESIGRKGDGLEGDNKRGFIGGGKKGNEGRYV